MADKTTTDMFDENDENEKSKENIENNRELNSSSIQSDEKFGNSALNLRTPNFQYPSGNVPPHIQGGDITNQPGSLVSGDTGIQGMTPPPNSGFSIHSRSTPSQSDLRYDDITESSSSSEEYDSDGLLEPVSNPIFDEKHDSTTPYDNEPDTSSNFTPEPQNDNPSQSESPSYTNQGVKDSNNPIEDLLGDAVTSDDDEAGFHILSKAVAGVVRNKELQLPYNIGIIGHYGSGKSKIIAQLKKALELDIQGAVPVKIVNFDVGRYHSSEHIWSALIYAFFEAFKKDKKSRAAWDFFGTLGCVEKFTSISKIIGAFLLSILLISWKFIPFFKKIELFKTYFHELLFVASLFLLVRKILKIWLHPAVSGSIEKVSSMPLNFVKEFENRIAFESKLKRLFKAWIGKDSDKRIVLIIENLDRCSKKHVIEIVDELYALISTPEIENKLICIVSVDDEALKKAIEESHGVESDEYFEKLFSLKLHVPKLAGYKLKRFLNELTGYKSREFISSKKPELDLNFDNYNLKDDEKEFLFQMLGGAANRDGVTPRKAKRVISSYQFLKYIWPTWFPDEDFIPPNLASAVFNRLSGKQDKLEGVYKIAANLIGKENKEDKKEKEDSTESES